MKTSRLILGAAALGFLVAGLWTGFAYRRDLAAARARVSVGSSLAQTKCGPIEYAVRGDGPPVLVVHGAGGGFDQGLMLGESLHGFQIIAPSRFGYLGTPLPTDGSAEAQADAHACLLDSLRVERAAVVAVSAGAPSAMQFCLRHAKRCSALVLLVPLAWSDRPASSARLSPAQQFFLEHTLSSDFAFWLATHLFRGAMVESILGTPLEDVDSASPRDQQRTYAMLDLIQPISRRAQGLRNERSVAQSLRRYELEEIVAPTLVASVEDCGYLTYEPARYTAEHIPGARFIGYPRGGHLWLGHDAELAAEVKAFLEGESSRTPVH
jgi:pimeloyl-ACP methyl ester carboxylesterase